MYVYMICIIYMYIYSKEVSGWKHCNRETESVIEHGI